MVRMNLEFVDRKITSELFKIWPKNDQVGQHVVEWWENLLQVLCMLCAWWQLAFPPLHHVLTYLQIAQPDFDAFRPFCYNGKDQTDSSKKYWWGGGHRKTVSLYYITLFTCKCV